MKKKINQIATLLSESNYPVVMTGAGMSVESGIPPFRGTSGIWTKYGQPKLDSFSDFKKNPTKWWDNRRNLTIDKHIMELRESLKNAKPHLGHYSLCWLEKNKYIKSIITQNIDGLDLIAGSKKVIEIHGNRKRLRCLSCNKRIDLGEYLPVYAPEPCEICGGTVKFDTVLFGEPIPKDIMKNSRQEIDKSDLIIAVGTSATVRPASGLFWIAKSQGAKIIEVNIEKTKLTTISDYFINSKAKSFFVDLENELAANSNHK
ncbi:MAG: Sir2 family NAD-dependent protein deacetylase [Dehalococcoidia bacterium]